MIVLNMYVFSARDIVARSDPPPGLAGRLGGLHLKRRTAHSREGLDLCLSVGYAYQNTDEESKRQRFWTALRRVHLGDCSARTQHMSAVDANGHVGIHEVPHEGPKLIGTAGAELTNAQGGQLTNFVNN